MTLLEQVITTLDNLGRDSEDIIFIGSIMSGHRCEWDEFVELADIELTNDARLHVAEDLEIVLDDGTLINCNRLDKTDECVEYGVIALLINDVDNTNTITSIITDEDWTLGYTLKDINDHITNDEELLDAMLDMCGDDTDYETE